MATRFALPHHQYIAVSLRRRVGHKVRTAPKSNNVYLKLIVKLYRFLARRTESPENKIILKRLFMSRTNRPPLSVSRLAKHMKGKDGKTAVIAGTVTDDVRMATDLPAMKVCALKFTAGARARITASGGSCITFDQLALQDPKAANCVLLRGAKTAREANKHFGHRASVNSIHTHCKVKPYVRTSTKTRKIENARGRRGNCGFKV